MHSSNSLRTRTSKNRKLKMCRKIHRCSSNYLFKQQFIWTYKLVVNTVFLKYLHHFFSWSEAFSCCLFLADTQNQLAVSIEKERTASDQVLDLGSKVTSLETQNSRLRQEKSQLTAQLEMLKTKVELSEETKQKYVWFLSLKSTDIASVLLNK